MRPLWWMLACGVAALLLSLVLAAWLTPRSWWRRPNARALAWLLVCSGGIGCALWTYSAPQLARAAHAVGSMPAAPAPALALLLPQPGQGYRVVDTLNLRDRASIGGARQAQLAPGTLVRASGKRHGDWWQVTATINGQTQRGWANSLWLRRADEGRP